MQTAASPTDSAVPSPSAATVETPKLLQTASDGALASSGSQKTWLLAGSGSQNEAVATASASQKEGHAVASTHKQSVLVGDTSEKEPPGATSSPAGIASVPQGPTSCRSSTRISSVGQSVDGQGDSTTLLQASTSAAYSPGDGHPEGSEPKPAAISCAGDAVPVSAADTKHSPAPMPVDASVSDAESETPSTVTGSLPVTVEVIPVSQYSLGDLTACRDLDNLHEMPVGEATDSEHQSTSFEQIQQYIKSSDQNQVEALSQTPTSACQNRSSSPLNISTESLAYRGRRKKGKPKRLVGEVPVPLCTEERLRQEAAIFNDHMYSNLSREHVGLGDQHESTGVQIQISDAEDSELDSDHQSGGPNNLISQESKENLSVCPEEIQTQKVSLQGAQVKVLPQDTQGKKVTRQELENRVGDASVNFQGVISFLRNVQLRNPPDFRNNEANSSLASRSTAVTQSSAGATRSATPDSTTSPSRAMGKGKASPDKVSPTAESHVLNTSAEGRRLACRTSSVGGGNVRPQIASAEELKTSTPKAVVGEKIAGPQNGSAANKRESPGTTSAEGRSRTIMIKVGRLPKAAGLETSRGGPPTRAKETILVAGHDDPKAIRARTPVVVASHDDPKLIIGRPSAHLGPGSAGSVITILKAASKGLASAPATEMAQVVRRTHSSSSPTRVAAKKRDERGEAPQASASLSRHSRNTEETVSFSAANDTDSHRSDAGLPTVSKDSASNATTQTNIYTKESATNATTQTRTYSTIKPASKDSTSNVTTQTRCYSITKATPRISVRPGASSVIEVTQSQAMTTSKAKPTPAVNVQSVQKDATDGSRIQVNLVSKETVAARSRTSTTFILVSPPIPPSTIPGVSVIATNPSAVPQVGDVGRSSVAAKRTTTSTKTSPAVSAPSTVDPFTLSTSALPNAKSVSSATPTWSKASIAVSAIQVSGTCSVVVANRSAVLSSSSVTPANVSSSGNRTPEKVVKASTSPTTARQSPRKTTQENIVQDTVQMPSHLPSVEVIPSKSFAMSEEKVKNPYVSLVRIKAPVLEDLHAGKTINISLKESFKQIPPKAPAHVDPYKSPFQLVCLDSSQDFEDDEVSGPEVTDSDGTVLFGDEESLPNRRGLSPQRHTTPGPRKATELGLPEKENNLQRKSLHMSTQPDQPEKAQTVQRPRSPQMSTRQNPIPRQNKSCALTKDSEKDSHSIIENEGTTQKHILPHKLPDKEKALGKYSGHSKHSQMVTQHEPTEMDTQTQEVAKAKTSHTVEASKSKTPHTSEITKSKGSKTRETIMRRSAHYIEATQDATGQSKEKQCKASQSPKTAKGLTDRSIHTRNRGTNPSHKPVASTAAQKYTVQDTQRETEVIENRFQPAALREPVNLECASAEKPVHLPSGPQTTQHTKSGDMAASAGAPKRPMESGADMPKHGKKRKARVSAEKFVMVYPEVQFDLHELFTPVHKLRHRSSEPRESMDTGKDSRESADSVSFHRRYSDDNSMNASDLPVTFACQLGNGEDGSSLATSCHLRGSEYNPTVTSSAAANSIYEENVDLPYIGKPRRTRLQEKKNEHQWERSGEHPKDESGEDHTDRGKRGECHRKTTHAKPSATVTRETLERGAPATLDRDAFKNSDNVVKTGIDIRPFKMFSTQGDSLYSSSDSPQTIPKATCKRSLSSKADPGMKFKSRKQQIKLAKVKKLKRIENRQIATVTSETYSVTSPQIFTPSVAESVKQAENRRKSALQPYTDLETTTAQIAESLAASVLSEISPLATNGQKAVDKIMTASPKVRTGRTTLYPTPSDSVYISPGRFNHGKVSKYECKKCDATFKKYSYFRLHLKNHGKDRFACEVCSSTFGRKESLKNHRMIHTGEAAVDCHICGKTLSGVASLTTHVRIHTDERPYSCPLCPKTFRQQSALTSHYRVHTRDRPFRCNVCNKSYRFHKNLYNHKFTHTGERRYACTICDASYYQVSALNVHLKVHTGERPFACELCSMRFVQKAHLAKHLRDIHQDQVRAMEEREAKNASKPYKCGSCGQFFTSFFSKGRHVKHFCTAVFAPTDTEQTEQTN